MVKTLSGCLKYVNLYLDVSFDLLKMQVRKFRLQYVELVASEDFSQLQFSLLI